MGKSFKNVFDVQMLACLKKQLTVNMCQEMPFWYRKYIGEETKLTAGARAAATMAQLHQILPHSVWLSAG